MNEPQNPYGLPEQRDNVYAPPRAAAPTEAPAGNIQDTPYFPTSLTKLSALYFASFGVYPIYGFYQNWIRVQKTMSVKIMPFPRALFYIFFTHDLFRRVHASATVAKISVVWTPGMTAASLVLLAVTGRIIDRITLRSEEYGVLDVVGFALMALQLIPMYVVQRTINQINGDPSGAYNSRITAANIGILVLGGVLWLVVLLSFLNPAWLGE